jgi:hypothetical protein
VEALIHGSEAMVGKAEIRSAYRLALEGQSVEISINGSDKNGIKEIRLSFLVEPVATFKMCKLAETSENHLRKTDNTVEEYPFRYENRNNL